MFDLIRQKSEESLKEYNRYKKELEKLSLEIELLTLTGDTLKLRRKNWEMMAIRDLCYNTQSRHCTLLFQLGMSQIINIDE